MLIPPRALALLGAEKHPFATVAVFIGWSSANEANFLQHLRVAKDLMICTRLQILQLQRRQDLDTELKSQLAKLGVLAFSDFFFNWLKNGQREGSPIKDLVLGVGVVITGVRCFQQVPTTKASNSKQGVLCADRP